MKTKRKIQGILYILTAYAQFLVIGEVLDYVPDQIFLLVPIVSIFLVFALSAKGLIVLFSDKEIKKDDIPKQT